MFFIDKLVLNYLYDACENMGEVFGLSPFIGGLMWLILIGGMVTNFLQGGRKKW
ncbi:MAG: hypothetical protein AB9836_04355 [Aminipila sp.]